MPVETWKAGSQTDVGLEDMIPFLNRLSTVNDSKDVMSSVINDERLDFNKIELFL